MRIVVGRRYTGLDRIAVNSKPVLSFCDCLNIRQEILRRRDISASRFSAKKPRPFLSPDFESSVEQRLLDGTLANYPFVHESLYGIGVLHSTTDFFSGTLSHLKREEIEITLKVSFERFYDF